jgi:serine protease Do
VRNLTDQNEMSVYGTPGVTGVLVLDVSAGSALATAGLKKDDVILFFNSKPTDDLGQLIRMSAKLKAGDAATIGILRNQKALKLNLIVADKAPTP